MINTRANVEQYAKEKGLEPIQIDGIPEGFSFTEPDITIGGITHSGNLVAFVPNTSEVIRTKNLYELLEAYFKAVKIRNGK